MCINMFMNMCHVYAHVQGGHVCSPRPPLEKVLPPHIDVCADMCTYMCTDMCTPMRRARVAYRSKALVEAVRKGSSSSRTVRWTLLLDGADLGGVVQSPIYPPNNRKGVRVIHGHGWTRRYRRTSMHRKTLVHEEATFLVLMGDISFYFMQHFFVSAAQFFF